MAQSLCRAGSLCAPEDLLSLLQQRRLPAFEAALAEPGCDPDQWFDHPHYGSLLDLACQQPDGQFVAALLRAGADPNRANRVRKRPPLHFAAEARSPAALAALLADARTQAGALDAQGNSALQALLALPDGPGAGGEQELACVRALLGAAPARLDPDRPNRKGKTALYLAAERRRAAAARLLLEWGAAADADRTYDGRTARQLLLANLPELAPLVDKIPPAGAQPEPALLQLLYARDEAGLLRRLQAAPGKPDPAAANAHDGSDSLLQRAAAEGLLRAARALLDAGADPSGTAPGNALPPAALAAGRGHPELLQLLLERGGAAAAPGGDSALLRALRGADSAAASELPRWERCVQLLLERRPELVNRADSLGNSPLLAAARPGLEPLQLRLLRAGAYLGARNCAGASPLDLLAPATLRTFLDGCVGAEGSPRRDDFRLTFDVRFLRPPAEGEEDPEAGAGAGAGAGGECEPLLALSRLKDLRPLLSHPVLTAFLELKWRGVRPFFWANLAFYSLFVALLTLYILLWYAPGPGRPGGGAGAASPPAAAWAALALLWALLLLRELFQLTVAPRRYAGALENYLELGLLLAAALVLFLASAGPALRPHLAATAVLLAWAELVLLVGRHPRLSTHIEMLKTVSRNFLEFLAWYSLLIVAFALSFYSLFRGGDEGSFFDNPGSSFFKTVVMVTGEFEAGELPFMQFPGTSHVVFVLFVFLVAIVLFNLLNGLAVSDTQAIREDAELVGIVSRVSLIAYTEQVVLGRPFCCGACAGLRRLSPAALAPRVRRVRLFPHALPEGRICVLPNVQGQVLLAPGPAGAAKAAPAPDGGSACYSSLCCRSFLDPEVLRAAERILEGRAGPDGSGQLEKRLEALEAAARSSQQTLGRILELLEAAQSDGPGGSRAQGQQ